MAAPAEPLPLSAYTVLLDIFIEVEEQYDYGHRSVRHRLCSEAFELGPSMSDGVLQAPSIAVPHAYLKEFITTTNLVYANSEDDEPEVKFDGGLHMF